ncbi:hypothetical protein C7431_11189 [Pantoea allii]|uniref:Uncharacterized protein n=1 Tax=Pantoea allii TaxID=574096 RepID=A0A2V2BHP3_9GAMM|nr:hypothetical protein [Pantoea allii]PWK94352.1 hypothetical protein C7431_11189 [Pantoea allii]
MNQTQADSAKQAQWKQFERILLMNHLWLKRRPVNRETWIVWSLTAALTLITFTDLFSAQARPWLLTAAMTGLGLSCVLWLRWRSKPKCWCDLIAAVLVSYSPADHDAFARLQHNVREEGHLDQDELGRWIKREMRILTRQNFAFTSRTTTHEVEAHSNDYTERP